MINRLTGTTMLVDESRVEKYLANGHMLAEVPAPVAPEPEPKPKTAKKRTTKK